MNNIQAKLLVSCNKWVNLIVSIVNKKMFKGSVS